MLVRFLPRDQQRQLERLVEADPADLLRRRLGDKQVRARALGERQCAGWP
jgi:hypothetical protein